MPNAEVSEMRIVLSDYGHPSSEWWDALLNKLKSHHIPSLYQNGKRMWADPFGTAMIYFTSDMVSVDEAVEILKQTGFNVHRALPKP
jgi:hypothetical protein